MEPQEEKPSQEEEEHQEWMITVQWCAYLVSCRWFGKIKIEFSQPFMHPCMYPFDFIKKDKLLPFDWLLYLAIVARLG